MDEDMPILMRSWSFPPEFSPDIRPTKLVSGKENVRQSLLILFSTRPGERVYRPEYGFSFEEIMFEPNTLGSKTRILNSIKRAVARFEPRVRLNQVRINEEKALEGTWEIELNYTLVSNGEEDSLTYVFSRI